MSEIRNATDLRAAVLARYGTLSPRLQDIAQFMLDDPHSMGVETLAVIAERIKVPPSAIVRFAKTFGFSGAGPMQRLLKDGLLERQAESVYHKRAREFSRDSKPLSDYDLLGEFARASILALENVSETVKASDFERAMTLIGEADSVFVAGFMRSFPVAAYLAYALQQSGKRAILVDGVGGLARQQAGQIRGTDLLIGISFAPYSADTIALMDSAAASGAATVAITDSLVGPIAQAAGHIIRIQGAEVRGFRTLAASMCLVQSMAVAYAFRDDPQFGKSEGADPY